MEREHAVLSLSALRKNTTMDVREKQTLSNENES